MTFKSPGDIGTVNLHNCLRFRLLFLAALVSLLAASCGSDRLEGRLVLSGSATIAPLAAKAAEAWKKLHPRVEVRVEAIGSDAGLERLVRYSDADLALVSRPLADTDREAASAAGKVLVPLPVAWDAVCLVVPPSNTWAKSLTPDQTARAFTTAVLWSDLDPAWPTSPIHRFVLGPNSGTADVFAAAVLGGNKALLYQAPEVQASEEDRILARGLAQVDGSLGFLGWTTYQEVASTLRTVSFAGVAPTAASIRDGSYGLPRHLWLTAVRDSVSPAVKSFVRFLYDQYPALTSGTGLVPLTADELRAVRTTLNESF